jgi:hypothetical protein
MATHWIRANYRQCEEDDKLQHPMPILPEKMGVVKDCVGQHQIYEALPTEDVHQRRKHWSMYTGPNVNDLNHDDKFDQAAYDRVIVKLRKKGTGGTKPPATAAEGHELLTGMAGKKALHREFGRRLL